MVIKMLSDNLKKYRAQSGYTQKEIAKKIHLSQQAYAKYETGLSNPTPEVLSSLADIYGVTTDELLDRPKETPLVNGDPELTAYLEELRTRPEMRMLFDVTKDATLEDVQTAVKIIEALRGKPDVDT